MKKKISIILDLFICTIKAELYMLYHVGTNYNFFGCTLSLPMYWRGINR